MGDLNRLGINSLSLAGDGSAESTGGPSVVGRSIVLERDIVGAAPSQVFNDVVLQRDILEPVLNDVVLQRDIVSTGPTQVFNDVILQRDIEEIVTRDIILQRDILQSVTQDVILQRDILAPAGLTFRSWSVGGAEGAIGTSSGNGLVRTMSSPAANCVIAYWERNLANTTARTRFAGTTGREQVFEGTASTITARSNNISTGTANAAITADTWTHVMVVWNSTTNQRFLYIDNGTPLSVTDASAFTTFELDDASPVYTVAQDDGEDADCDSIFFDFIFLNSASDLSGLTPTDVNYSTANGGEWVQFTDWGTYTNQSFGIGGTNALDFGEDYSGNGNDFTQSTGGSDPIVNRSGDAFGGVPPGA